MSDPFQDVDSGGAEFVKAIGDALEVRAAEATMQAIVDGYLSELSYPPGGLHVEIGAGTGAIARKIAAHAKNGKVIGSDLSPGLIEYAKARPDNPDNLSFEVATGAELRFGTGSVDAVIMHTVLSHVPDPTVLLAEAVRVLKPGGALVICDGDFAKMTLGNALGDPLGAFAVYFADNFVTDKYLVGKLQGLVTGAGLSIRSFEVKARVISGGLGGMNWVAMGGKMMVERGLLGLPVVAAMVGEYHRRIETKTLYGFLPFAIMIADR